MVPEAQAPYQKYITDAGYDLSAASVTKTDNYIECGTGLAFEIPVGMVGLIFPRSSVTEKDLMLKNCVGVIDSEFRGEVRCRFVKVIHRAFEDSVDVERKIPIFGKEKIIKKRNIIDIMILLPGPIKIYEIGDRICQIIFLTLPQIKLMEAQELSESNRGSQGYGSTGK